MTSATRSPSPQLRLAACCSLAVVELLATTLFARLPDVWNIWPVIGVAHAAVKILVLSLAIFALISWPKRAEIVSAFNNSTVDAPVLPTAAVSIAAVLCTALLRYYIAEVPQDTTTLASYLYAATLSTAVVSLLLVGAPISFWRIIARTCRLELVLSLFFGLFGLVVGELLKRAGGSFFSEENWAELSHATLQLSYWIAKSIDSGTFMDHGTRILGAGNFSSTLR